MIAAERLADIFVEVADTLVEDFDLVEFLHRVAALVVEASGEAAAGILLTDHHGRLRYVGASREEARLFELFELQNVEGPCLDCASQGQPIGVADLTMATTRWPRFAPEAGAAGFRSVYAFPLRLRSHTIGAINVLGVDPRVWTEAERKVVQGLADVAAIALIQEQASARADLLNEQLQSALNSRVIIEQAKGAVARTLAVTPAEAFQVIRAYAREHRRPLSDLAQELVTDSDAIGRLG